MIKRPDSWKNKNILKIKSELLREIKEISEDKDVKNSPQSLRKEIEPWLTALFQSEHLSLLMGTGITNATHLLATKPPEMPKGMQTMNFSVFQEQIQVSAKESARKAHRGTLNIEDQIRVGNDLIQGLNIYLSSAKSKDTEKKIEPSEYHSDLEKKRDTFKKELEEGINKFAEDILTTERNVAISEQLESTMNYLTSFLVSFCSRAATRERLNLFTTNYDRLIEFGAELAGLRLIDRFVGNLNPIFRASRLSIDMHYNPPGIRGEPRYLEGVVHYTKLHGSLDWVNQGDSIRRFALPFGTDKPIDQFFPPLPTQKANSNQLMIYPNASKDRETAEYPYVELFRDLAAAICRPNSTLILYGYGFGDDHINRIIRDMLSIPSTHLVIIAYSDEGDRAKRFYDSVGRSAQISVLVGPHFGNLQTLVDYYLPKPAIDRATLRMADLLKSRGLSPTIHQNEHDEENS